MNRFKNILYVAESGEGASAALERAVNLAENNHARLTVVGVVPHVTSGIGMPEGGPISARVQAALVDDRRRALEELARPYRERIDMALKVLEGTPFLEIVREVLREGRDLVVKAPELEDWLDRLFGSDDMHLLRKCPCPVWLTGDGGSESYRRILVALDWEEDGSAAETEARRALNQQLLDMAGSLALAESAELHVVHVWYAPGASVMRGGFMNTPEAEVVAYVEQVRRQHRGFLDGVMAAWGARAGSDTVGYLKPTPHLVRGTPRQEIPALARRIEADLIVMGTVARTGIPGFIMGNTAEAILGRVGCSVLAAKPPGFTTPVTLEEP